jgi:hypothetical protein
VTSVQIVLEGHLYFSRKEVIEYCLLHEAEWVSNYNDVIRAQKPRVDRAFEVTVKLHGPNTHRFYRQIPRLKEVSWFGPSYSRLVHWAVEHPTYADGEKDSRAKTLPDWPPGSGEAPNAGLPPNLKSGQVDSSSTER